MCAAGGLPWVVVATRDNLYNAQWRYAYRAYNTPRPVGPVSAALPGMTSHSL